MNRTTIDVKKVRRYLSAIAQPVRLDILLMLKGGELCVCDIYSALNISQNLTSHHLSVLTELGLLTSWKVGVKMLYSRDEKVLRACQTALSTLMTKDNSAVHMTTKKKCSISC